MRACTSLKPAPFSPTSRIGPTSPLSPITPTSPTRTLQNYHSAIHDLLFGDSDSEDSDEEETTVEEKYIRPTPPASPPIPPKVELKRPVRQQDIECGCCNCEYPPKQITRCYANHPFCFTCARRNAENEIGMYRHVVRCMDTFGCQQEFPRREVLRFLDKKTLAALDRIKLEASLPKAGVNTFVSICPHCEYVVICGTIEEKMELDCTNPACMKTSCRLCRKNAHEGISCEDYERLTAPQLTEEEKITNATLKRCNNCKTPFIKDSGCNKMYCTRCDNIQCYLCSENISSYDHFKGWADGMVCELYGDGTETTQDEAEQPAAEEQKGPEELSEGWDASEEWEESEGLDEESLEYVGDACGIGRRYDLQRLERFYV